MPLSKRILPHGKKSLNANSPNYYTATGTLDDNNILTGTTNSGSKTWTANLSALAGGGGVSSPLTTKGDVWVYSNTNTRLPVGTDGYVLAADSNETTGLKWTANDSSNYYVTALTWGTDNKITGSRQGTTAITSSALTTFTPKTYFTTGIAIGGNTTEAGYIELYEDDNDGDKRIKIKAAAMDDNYDFTLPNSTPAGNGYALVATTAGVMSWSND